MYQEVFMMKKAIIFTLVLALVIMLLSGCQGNSFSLDEGLYVLEQTEKNGGAAPAVPYLIVHGGSLYVVLDMGVSYQPSGAVTVNGNKVVMETVFANEPCKWTFKLIDNNRLKFVSAKSDIPPYGEAWKNGMVFVRAEEETAGLAAVPEDFSFALTWNCYGESSYDSLTGELVKTTDATNPEDYVTNYQLTGEDKEYIYHLLGNLDVNSFPDVYDPNNGLSKPNMTLILTVRVNGEVKTITAKHIALSFESKDEKGQQFLSVCEVISNRLMETEAWKALPNYEFLYE